MRRLAEGEKMFRRVSRVLVAVSGGPDSMACLLILRALGEDLGFTAVACHFDHQLRPESRDDMERVRAMCAGLGIECVTGEGDVGGVAAQAHRGIEDMAREMRYQFLAFVAEKEGADCIATGHTADDQAETVLMRMVRGSGVRGMRGMLPVSDVPGAEAQRLVRPLLETAREATLAICDEFGLQALHDASNDDPRFTRNRIRHEVLPALLELNPSVKDALIGLAESAQEAFAPIERSSFEVQPFERGQVGALFEAAKFDGVLAEAIGVVIEREAGFYHLKPETNRTRVKNLQDILSSGSGSVLFGDTEVECSSGVVRVGPQLEQVEPFDPVVLNVPGVTLASGWRVEVRTDLPDAAASAAVAGIDPATVVGALRARRLEPGDRIRWHGIERKVSDLLINEKVPAWERAGMLAVADRAGVVALFGARGVYARDGGEPGLWLRVSATP